MQRVIARVLLILIIAVIAGCGFHLRGVNDVSHDFPVLMLDSDDPYSPLMRAIRHELRLSKVTLVDNALRQDIPALRITYSTETRNTVSVFRDGKTAENQLKLSVEAQVLIPGEDIQSLNVNVFRSFFENPLNVLAKSVESEVISQEMREQAAAQLVRKLLKIRVQTNGKNHHAASPAATEK